MKEKRARQEDIKYLTWADKFPQIVPKENEDLNIDRAINKILTNCWNDVKKYPTTGSISIATGISERVIYNRVKIIGLGKRNS